MRYGLLACALFAVLAGCRSDRPLPPPAVDRTGGVPGAGGVNGSGGVGAGGALGGAGGGGGAVDGGVDVCTGPACPGFCPAGTRLCGDTCIPPSAACGDDCPGGMNACQGSCRTPTDPMACGSACRVCPTSPHGKTTCDGDKCELTCDAGYHRCDDTCVADNDTGKCGEACVACSVPAGGAVACVGGTCVPSCPEGKRHCKGACIGPEVPCDNQCTGGLNPCNGSCVQPTDVTACGASCSKCGAPRNGKPTCGAGSCDFACNAGYHRCDAECRDSGSVDSCGTRCKPCPEVANATRRCRDGQCDFTCNVGRKCDDRCIPDQEPCGQSCKAGFSYCRARNLCLPAGEVGAEVCDGKDNDCDGQVDEGIAPRPCACGGSQTCGEGKWQPAECPDTRNDPGHCGPSCQMCGGLTPFCREGRCVADACTGENEELDPQGRCRCRARFTRCNGRCVPVDGQFCVRNDTTEADYCKAVAQEERMLTCAAGRLTVNEVFELRRRCETAAKDGILTYQFYNFVIADDGSVVPRFPSPVRYFCCNGCTLFDSRPDPASCPQVRESCSPGFPGRP